MMLQPTDIFPAQPWQCMLKKQAIKYNLIIPKCQPISMNMDTDQNQLKHTNKKKIFNGEDDYMFPSAWRSVIANFGTEPITMKSHQ